MKVCVYCGDASGTATERCEAHRLDYCPGCMCPVCSMKQMTQALREAGFVRRTRVDLPDDDPEVADDR